MTTASRDAGDRDGEDIDAVGDLGYAEAVTELEAILGRIEDDTVDIDQLSREVRRAAALIRLCQERIAGARLEVERVVADLEAGIDLASASGPASTGSAGTNTDADDPDDPDDHAKNDAEVDADEG